MSYDLAFVAPHRRDEVLRRIGVLEEFLKRPGRAAAERSASQLGLGVTQFYRLASVWAKHRKPDMLAGSASARARTTRATSRQVELVEAACTERPDDNVAVVASHAIALAAIAGVAMPSVNSVRKLVEMNRVGRVAPNSPAFGADIVIATCAVDVAVSCDDHAATMPVATFVIHTSPTPSVLGLALSLADGTVAAVARAIIDTKPAWTLASRPAPPIVAIETGREPGWRELVQAMAANGAQVLAMEPRAHSVMNDAVALLGRKPAGFRLLPDLTSKPVGDRRPRLPSGATALTLVDAETLLRERLISPRPTAPTPGISLHDAEWLVKDLEPIARGDYTASGPTRNT